MVEKNKILIKWKENKFNLVEKILVILRWFHQPVFLSAKKKYWGKLVISNEWGILKNEDFFLNEKDWRGKGKCREFL